MTITPNVDILLLFINIFVYKVSGDVCPSNVKVVYTCLSNYKQDYILYLDSSRSVGLDGTCRCFLQAIDGPVNVKLTSQYNVTSPCQAILDLTDFGILLACNGKTPAPTNHTFPHGSNSSISLIRSNKNTAADFCVQLEQTNPEEGGRLSLTCLERDKDDLILTDNTATQAPGQQTSPSNPDSDTSVSQPAPQLESSTISAATEVTPGTIVTTPGLDVSEVTIVTSPTTGVQTQPPITATATTHEEQTQPPVTTAATSHEEQTQSPVTSAATTHEEQTQPPVTTTATAHEEKTQPPVTATATTQEEQTQPPVTATATTKEEQTQSPVTATATTQEEQTQSPVTATATTKEEQTQSPVTPTPTIPERVKGTNNATLTVTETVNTAGTKVATPTGKTGVNPDPTDKASSAEHAASESEGGNHTGNETVSVHTTETTEVAPTATTGGPTSSINNSNTDNNGSEQPETGAQVQTETPVRSWESFLVVGILGGTILVLVLLGVLVYLRDRHATKGSTKPYKEEVEPQA